MSKGVFTYSILASIGSIFTDLTNVILFSVSTHIFMVCVRMDNLQAGFFNEVSFGVYFGKSRNSTLFCHTFPFMRFSLSASNNNGKEWQMSGC